MDAILLRTDTGCKLHHGVDALTVDFIRRMQKWRGASSREVIYMNRKSFCLTAGIIFIAIALLHLLRIVNDWKVAIGPWAAPDWISWVALVIAGYLGFEGIRLARSGWLLP